MSKTIYNADYSECLPEALKKDPKMVALANATAAALLDTSELNFEQSFEAMKKIITEKVG